MVSISRLRQRKKKGISPVIATIILIAVALVLALVVGVFAFGLFSANANTVSLKSATLTAPTTFAFSLDNPASLQVTVSLVTVNGACTGTYAAFTGVYSGTCTVGTAVTSGNNYNFDITLSNGQAITGVAVAV